MAQYTKEELETLDLIGPFGPFAPISGNSTFTETGLDLIGPFGPFYFIAPTGGTPPPSYNATQMFMIF
jgi:hypothetical protein